MPDNKGAEGTPAFNEQQTAALGKMVTDGIANAMKGVKIPSADDLGKLVDGKMTGVTDALAKLTEQFSTLKPGEGADDKGGKGGKEGRPEDKAAILDLTKKLEALTQSQTADRKAREDAEAKALATDKESKIRSVLSEFEYSSDAARNDAFKLVSDLVKRGDDGNLLGEGDLPFDSFIRSYIPEQKGYLLKPENRSGSGATNGSQNRSGGSGKVDIESIKPGMSKEATQAAVRAILQALPGKS